MRPVRMCVQRILLNIGLTESPISLAGYHCSVSLPSIKKFGTPI